jgi:hypothetical protein
MLNHVAAEYCRAWLAGNDPLANAPRGMSGLRLSWQKGRAPFAFDKNFFYPGLLMISSNQTGMSRHLISDEVPLAMASIVSRQNSTKGTAR